MNGPFDHGDQLRFVRQRLNKLADRRALGRLTEEEQLEYTELCLRELTLLNNSAPRPKPRRG